MHNFRAQGATEYLVLLAVVLIVALVSVALLGFFPGMASDAQAIQSKMYWQSAQPISIVEWGASYSTLNTPDYSILYLRVRNSGAYPIRITKILGAGGQYISQVYCAGCSDSNISTHFYLAPGEEKAFAASNPTRHILFRPASLCSSSSNVFCAETSGCNVNGSAAPGTVVVRNFGFEYIAYIDGQQVTKQQIGKDLSVACK